MLYIYNLREGLRYTDRERERGVKNRNLLFSWWCVGGTKQPVFQPKEAEPLYIITFQSIPAVCSTSQTVLL
jgi:hypothetical protein